MNNIHGARINMDIPERAGSGFVGKHGADFASFNDRSSQVLNLLTGPDGSVFMIDWYDKNQCHQGNEAEHDRSNGRIFKVSFGEVKAVKVDLQKLSDLELVNLLASKNAWHSRHAQRILQERYSAKPPTELVANSLRQLGGTGLRALWTRWVVGELDQPALIRLLQSQDEMTRAWSVQFLCEDRKPFDEALKEFARLAREDKSPVVRLYLASALQRLPVAQRGEILEGLLAHAEDATDQNLPFMYWYAAEPVAGESVASAAKLLAKTKIPQVREFITRRMTTK